MHHIIDMKNIQKSYDNPVLKGVNLMVKESEMVVIFGESGSGKSTLLNILGCIESRDEGTYLFNGNEIKPYIDYSDMRLNQIGFVYQNYNLISKITCLDNILLPTIYTSNEYDIEWLNEIVMWLDIKELLNKDVNILSGGEKQRVALARALLLKPRLIIADEPTGNLDLDNKLAVIEIFKKYILTFKASVIVVTHDKFIADEADTIYILVDGALHEKK